MSNLKSKRNSNLELLRIIVMLTIVSYHYSIYGFYSESIYFSPAKYLIDFLNVFGNTALHIFMLFSGYFMAEQRFTLKRFLIFAGQIWFYCILGAVFGLVQGRGGEIKILLFPILKLSYWFASYYAFIMLLSPFLNSFVHKASKRTVEGCLLLLFTVYCIFPNFLFITDFASTIGVMLFMYLLAAYTRVWRSTQQGSAKRHLLRALLWGGCILGFAWACDAVGQYLHEPRLLENSTRLNANFSVFGVMMAYELFQYFLLKESRYSPTVNKLASATFGVYLFHENYFFRDLWQMLFHTSDYAASPYLPLQAVVAIGSMFLMGVIIDLIRQATATKLWHRLLNRLPLAAIEEKGLELYRRAFKKLGLLDAGE